MKLPLALAELGLIDEYEFVALAGSFPRTAQAMKDGLMRAKEQGVEPIDE